MRNIELLAEWIGETWASSESPPGQRMVIGKAVAENSDIVTLKGYADEFELREGVTYRFFGHVRNHPKFGEQFHFSSFAIDLPPSEEAVEKYLTSIPRDLGASLTSRVARELVKEYGCKAIHALIRDPIEAASKVKGWDSKKAGVAANYFRDDWEKHRAKLELISLFEGHKFPRKSPDEAIKLMGTAAAQIIRDDAFEACRLRGVGFKKADKLYCELARKSSPDDATFREKLASLHRQGRCAAYHVAEESRNSGSTWIPEGIAIAAVRSTIGNSAKPTEAIEWAIAHGYLMRKERFLAPRSAAISEQIIASFLTKNDTETAWPSIDSIIASAPAGKPLTEHQINAIDCALSARIGCLQGSPGVGKTFAVAAIVKAIIRQFGESCIAAAAPTGKAGVRMSQSLAANGITTIEATTVHRMLGVIGSNGDGWQFDHDENKPLPFRYIIIDETSMMDCDLLSSLLLACPAHVHILFVGDTGQLAPVGHGKPFFDMQEIVPVGRLTEIHRNSGQIVKSCAEIRDNNTITFSTRFNPEAGENLCLIECGDSETAIEALQRCISKISATGIDSIRDIQVITGKNKGSALSREQLNEMLQKLLNSQNANDDKTVPFWRNDKIVCLKNSQPIDANDENKKLFVANGELGYVRDMKPGRVWTQLESPERMAMILHGAIDKNVKEDGETENGNETSSGRAGDWDLGYCITVHRSQGSQWKYVIVAVDPAASMIHNRNWLYTAISRAEVATIVIGKRRDVDGMLQKCGVSGRKTFLVEIAKELANYGKLQANPDLIDDIFADL